jgi:PAS domain S-box-containing protein
VTGSRTDDFALLADLFKEAILLVAETGEIRSANPAAQRLLGRPAADLVGQALSSLSDAPAEITQLLRISRRSRTFVPGSLTLRLKTGALEPCRCDGALYRPGSEGEPALVVLRLVRKQEAALEFLSLREKIRELTRENAARRAAEEALRESSEKYRVTLESIGDAVIATDPAGRVEFMNLVAQELTGWSAAESIGRHLDEVFQILNEDTRETVESPVAKVLRIGSSVGLANHTLLVRRDGSELPIDDSGAPIRDLRGRMRGVVLVFRDLTERHALERELLAKTETLQEADRRKNDFLAMLAHELRNPLAPVRNGIEVLRRRPDAMTVQRMADMMGRQMNHMVRLVDDLLDVSRLTKGKIELRLLPVKIPVLLQAAEEMARPLFEAAGVELQLVEPIPDVQVHGDHARLVQVLSNLLSNAARFSSRGQKVRLQGNVNGNHAEISVVDQGAGIAGENLLKVFELFYQEKTGLYREHSGLGVGLTISQTIVEMHGGTVAAESPGLGLGSTFTVRLPVNVEQAPKRTW